VIFKCKMCGGDIEPIENTNTGKCLYCKSVMTLPDLDNEKIVNLYNRANSLRLDNEFDKASGVYETILEIDNEQVEAHWGLILCKYGVEYVDDPVSKTKIPTCHRTIIDSILKDSNYIFIKKKAYGDALKLYEKEANQINEIQKRILDISSKEKPYDIFICYKETDKNGERTHDSVMAQDIYDSLEKEGYKVFFARITLEDKLGTEYEPYIFSALNSSKVMLALGTSIENFESIWVKNEWSRYLEFMKKDKSKTLIPVYSKIDAYKLPEEFAMLQAQNMDKVGAMQDLIRGIKKIIDASKNKNYDDFDAETIERLKASLDDSPMIGDNRYEVTEVKEKASSLFYISTIVVVGLLLIMKFFSVFGYFAYSFNLYDDYSMNSNRLPDIIIVIQFLATLMYFISGILKIKSRKTFEKSNYLILIGFVLEILTAFILLKYSFIPYINWIINVVLAIVLYFINPKWHLDASSKIIVNKIDKEKIQQKNKLIRDNFIDKSKQIIKIKVIFAITFILAIIYIALVYFKYTAPQENGRNNQVEQLEVIAKTLYINELEIYSYDDDYYSYDSYHIGMVREGEIYTILDKIYTDDGYCRVWYEIETETGINGFVCGLDHSNRYVKLLAKGNEEYLDSSNIRDTSKNQLKVTAEYLNIRDDAYLGGQILGMVEKNQIYDILDVEENGVYTWYKIKTSTDIIGWIAGIQYNESYIEIYAKEK